MRSGDIVTDFMQHSSIPRQARGQRFLRQRPVTENCGLAVRRRFNAPHFRPGLPELLSTTTAYSLG